MMKTSDYPNSQYSNPLEVGAEFLDFVTETLCSYGMYLQPFTSKKYQYSKGESVQGWEVKLDKRFTDTGRLSIEIAEKTRASNNEWVKSGIYRNDNTWIYIQGNYEYFYIFLKKHLIKAHSSRKYEECESFGTIRKFYLPISDAEIYGHKIYCYK